MRLEKDQPALSQWFMQTPRELGEQQRGLCTLPLIPSAWRQHPQGCHFLQAGFGLCSLEAKPQYDPCEETTRKDYHRDLAVLQDRRCCGSGQKRPCFGPVSADEGGRSGWGGCPLPRGSWFLGEGGAQRRWHLAWCLGAAGIPPTPVLGRHIPTGSPCYSPDSHHPSASQGQFHRTCGPGRSAKSV